MSKEIKVSIMCCTYNQEDYIADALESFIMQKTDFAFEILVHDDASSDHTPDIIRQYQQKYPNLIKPTIQTENQYSKGIDIITSILYPVAEGEYIALCEGDDYWTDNNKLQKQYDYMESHTECYICTHAADRVDAQTKVVLGKKELPANRQVYDMKGAIEGFGRWCATSSFFYRSSVYEQLPRFFAIAPCGDYVIPIMCAEKGTLAYLPDNMSCYRVKARNSLSEIWSKNIEALLSYDLRYDAMLSEIDSHTNYAYADELRAERTRIWFNYYVRTRDKEKLETDEYKAYVSRLPIKKRLRFYSQVYCPVVVNIYLKVKSMIASVRR